MSCSPSSSERERRAKVIHAEGEYQAAEWLRDAAELIKNHPVALQFRYLQTLAEGGASTNNTTVAFPVPIELLSSLAQGFASNGGHEPVGPSIEPAYR